jgi:hypothetical protein
VTDRAAHSDSVGAAEAGHLKRFLRGKPGGDRDGLLVLLAVIAVAIASSAVEPRWILGVGDALRRIGGIWRILVMPVPVTLLGVALTANVLAPGSVWRWVRSRPNQWWRTAAFALATLLALLASALQLGITLTQLMRPVVLWVLQVVLHPQTPTAIVATAALLAVIVADRRRFVVLPWAVEYIVDQSRAAMRWFRPVLPVGAAMVAAGIAAAALYPSAMQGWFRADPPDAQAYNIYSSFFNYSISKDKIIEFDGYELGEAGLVLAPGRTGVLTFALARPGGSLVLLKANFYNRRFLQKGEVPGSFSETIFENAIEVSGDGGRTWGTAVRDASVGDVVGSAPLDLTPLVGRAETYLLRFRTTNVASTPVLAMSSMIVSVVVDPLTAPHPSFPMVTYAAGMALACATLLRVYFDRGVAALGGGFASIVLLVSLAYATGSPSTILKWVGTELGLQAPSGLLDVDRTVGLEVALRVLPALLLLVVAVTTIAVVTRHGAVVAAARLLMPWAVTVGCLAIGARWDLLVRVRYDFLLPDAQGYLYIARSFEEKAARFEGTRDLPLLKDLYASGFDGQTSLTTVFFAGGHNGREPLWSAAIALVAQVLGFSAFHTRLTSIAFAVGVASLACAVGWRRLNPLIGVGAGLIVAASVPHIGNNVHGLREELVTVAILSAVFVLTSPRPRIVPTLEIDQWRRLGWPERWPIAGVTLPRWRVATASLACAGIILTRADMIVTVAILLGTLAIAYRWGWRTSLPMGSTIVVLVAPMYLGYWFTHGDPFWPGTYGATVNRNLEFPDRMGTPGFPSAAEYAANWAAGPLISPFTYFFGYHSGAQFISYSVAGVERIFREILFPDQPIILTSFWVGLGLTIVTRQWLAPWGIAIGLFPFYAFMAGVPSAWVFPGRYAHQVLPFAAMAVSYAWVAPLSAAWRLISRRYSRSVKREIIGVGG